VENLDDIEGQNPTLDERLKILRPQVERLKSDIICFQEVHGQEIPGRKRDLLALKKLLLNTNHTNIESTKTTAGEVYDKRNLVVAGSFEMFEPRQLNNDLVKGPEYDMVTEIPPSNQVKKIQWERPIFYVKIKVKEDFIIHLINLHLKSRIPANIPGQKKDNYTWKSSAGWAEGFFISSMKRVGQALETRILIDRIFDEEADAKIIVCGDFNAHPDEVPVEAIIGKVENTGNKELVNRVLLPCENTIPETSRYTFIHQGNKRMLDHMLISRAMIPYYRFAEIHNEILHDESLAYAYDEKFPESDHAPFVVEFDIPG
jgi:predicted extracellular nuclease